MDIKQNRKQVVEDAPRLHIKATVKTIRFYNPDNHFAILIVTPEENLNGEEIVYSSEIENEVTLTGTFYDPQPGDSITVKGKLMRHERFGYQYQLTYSDRGDTKERSAEDKATYLLHVLTPMQFNNAYDVLEDPFDALEKGDVEQLIKIHNIGLKNVQGLINKFHRDLDFFRIYTEIAEYDLTENAINALLKKYKSIDLMVNTIKENPYKLVLDHIPGYGFKRVDNIALKAGIDKSDPRRVMGFMYHYLDSMGEEGDSYITVEELVDGIQYYLGDVNQLILQESLRELEKSGEMWCDKEHTKVGSMYYFNMEDKIAQHLLRIKNGKNNFEYDGWEERVRQLEEREGMEFTDEQWEGIKTVLENQVVLITGPSGSGKSTLVSGMLAALAHKYEFRVCALAGRAAARLAEVTHDEGYTIHRLLGYSPGGGWRYNEHEPLPDDIIVNDEVGMDGADIFYRLVQSIKTGAKLIMVGDERQLAPIGAGNIAHDVLFSPYIPTVRLTKIHRQAAKSAIITESIKISNGKQILPQDFSGKEVRGELQDLRIDAYLGANNTFYHVIERAQTAANQGVSPDSIQVILPNKTRGDASVYSVNNTLQEFFNPHVPGSIEMDVRYESDKIYTLRLNDRVINRKNNYKAQLWEGLDQNFFDKNTREYTTMTIPVYNGNIGHVKEIYPQYNMLVIDFDGIGVLAIQGFSVHDIQLAYAITCHSAQGCEMDYVIVGLDYSGYSLLSRQWVYTAITRAKKVCVLCCETPALRYAISNNEIIVKRTHLQERLHALSNPEIEY